VRAAAEKQNPVLVIGYGNPLRSDDAFGWCVAARLEQEGCGPMTDVLACHQLTPELAEEIRSRRLVVFVDVEVGCPVGEIRQRAVDPDPSGAPVFGHTLEPKGLLSLTRGLFGGAPEAILISTGGVNFEIGDVLSLPVEIAVARTVGEIRRISAQAAASLNSRPAAPAPFEE